MTFRCPFLIFNPAAGRFVGAPRREHALVDHLRQLFPNLSVLPTAHAGHATSLARQAVLDGADLVLAAGGDGSINEVINGLAATGVTLGILPSGTANVLATETGIPKDPLRAAAKLASCVPIRIALGRVVPGEGPPRYFAAMCGAGLDAAVIGRLDKRLKNRIGKAAYWAAGFSLLGSRLPRLRVNGQETSFAIASRVRNYGGDLTIASSASLLNNELRVLAFEGTSSWSYLPYLGAALIGKAESLKGANATFSTRTRMEGEGFWQVDGELGGPLPITVEIVPDSLTLLVPPAFAQRG